MADLGTGGVNMNSRNQQDRREMIVGSPSAVGREELAAYLAAETNLSFLQAITILQKAPMRKLSLAEQVKVKFSARDRGRRGG